jgi:hypothetical protein
MANFEAAIGRIVQAQLDEGTGAGQKGWAATNQTILSTVQQLLNEGRTQSSSIIANENATKDSVLGYLTAHPTTVDLTDNDKQSLATIVGMFNEVGVQVDPAPFLAALSARLAA